MSFASQCEPTPTVVGDPRPGSILTASIGVRRSDSGPTYGFQWLADGRAIAGATSATHTVSPSEVGRQIVVEVTRSDGSVVASDAVTVTKVISTVRLTVPEQPTTPRTRPVLVVAVTAQGDLPVIGSVIVLDGAREVGRTQLEPVHRGTVEVRLKRLGVGTHTLAAHYRGTDAVSASWAPTVPLLVARATAR
ncbi:MAG: Ig-like domain-containing protein [Nocardioides sp.]